jgi:hypothetical protein
MKDGRTLLKSLRRMLSRIIQIRWIASLYMILMAVIPAWQAHCATGDILSASVETNGWVLDVAIEGLTNSPGTSGLYNFGLGTNNSLTGQPTVVVSVISMGFDDTGTPITVPRTVYGTLALRLPYPNQTNKDQVVVNGVLTNKIVLSDYVFARDSNIVVQIGAAYYTDRTKLSNNAGTLAVVNGSVLAYQRPIANWTWPGWDRITGSSFTLRAVGFHQSAQQGRPVRLMRFIAQDAHQNRVTNDVLQMSVDPTLGDQLPFGEYVGAMPTASLTEGDVITNTFQAYPWIGDRPLDSGDGVNVPPTPLYSPLYMLNDKTGQYGSTIAVVAPTGSDAGGVAVDSASFDSNSPPAAFATIAGAASAVAATNKVIHGRDDLGGGVVYLRSGSYAWLGASKKYGNLPECFFEVATFPGDTNAIISSATSGENTLGVRVMLYNLNITSSSTPSSTTFTGETNLWLNGCTINASATAVIYNVPIWYVTECNIIQLPQAIYPYSTENSSPALVRGNLTTVGSFAYTMCGNVFNGPMPAGEDSVYTYTYANKVPPADGSIIYNNSFYRLNSTCYEEYYGSLTNGLVWVQNLAILATNGGVQFFVISGNTATNDLCNNVIFWHNNALGRDCSLAYNAEGSTALMRVFWSVKNNLLDKLDTEADTAAGGSGPDGARTGDWSEVFGVSYSGNFNANINGVGLAEYFNPEFLGLNSFQPTESTSAGFFQFIDNEAYNGIASGNGFGNYHLCNSSPVFGLTNEWLLPFDLAGNPRQPGDVAGIYAAQPPAPMLTATGFPSPGQFQFGVSNLVGGTSYIVQGSPDLKNWTSIATNIASSPSFPFTVTNASGFSYQFYRLVGPIVP